MAIVGATSQTAVEACDKRWATSEGRADWLEPHPAVVAIVPELHARGARRCSISVAAWGGMLLRAEHGFDVEAIATAALRALPWCARRPLVAAKAEALEGYGCLVAAAPENFQSKFYAGRPKASVRSTTFGRPRRRYRGAV